MKTQLTIAFVAVLALAAAAQQAKNYAPKAFRKIQTLAGDWEGKDDQGSVVRTNFKAMISNTVVMETLNAAGMEEMLTLYSQDGNGVALLHYCPTNNQPHMRAVPTSADVKQLSFAFIDAGNLPSIAMGHEHKMVLDFEDKDHITEHWTWRKNGKDMEMVYHLARK
jgi:hypothetical protein